MITDKVFWLLKRLVSVSNYPRYMADIYMISCYSFILRKRGVKLGSGISWNGMPILTRAGESLIIIGSSCRICSRSSDTALGVNHPVVLRTVRCKAELRIGSGVRMSGTTICAAEKITIGDRCVIGANVTIVDTDFHSLDPNLRSSQSDSFEACVRPVEIGDDVFIGGGSYILKGSTVGCGAIIGAGSVVCGFIPQLSVYAGNPAKQIKMLSKGFGDR